MTELTPVYVEPPDGSVVRFTLHKPHASYGEFVVAVRDEQRLRQAVANGEFPAHFTGAWWVAGHPEPHCWPGKHGNVKGLELLWPARAVMEPIYVGVDAGARR